MDNPRTRAASQHRTAPDLGHLNYITMAAPNQVSTYLTSICHRSNNLGTNCVTKACLFSYPDHLFQVSADSYIYIYIIATYKVTLQLSHPGIRPRSSGLTNRQGTRPALESFLLEGGPGRGPRPSVK